MSVNLEKIEDILSPLANSLGYDLITCEWAQEMGRNILRVYLDKAEGILLEDCEKFSHMASASLDVEDPITQSYDLEISSPGINRPLKRPKDFERFLGQPVKVKTKIPLDGRARYKGILKKIENEIIWVEVDTKDYQIPLSQIEKANLELSAEAILKKGRKK